MGNQQSTDRYVVLVGDVGTGKSTIVERLTDEIGRSANAATSVTKSTEMFWAYDRSMIIADTPGCNPLKEDKLEHNIGVAAAINYQPVTKIFIVVKAETRIDAVISNVRKYAESLVDLDCLDVIAVLLTHMDTVNWTENEFRTKLVDELKLSTVVLSSINTSRETLLGDIQNTFTKQHNLTIDSRNFFKLFKIHDYHIKILKSTSDEVKLFTAKKKSFDQERKAFKGKDLVNLVFEFQAYMTEEIVKAQQRMSKNNQFTFSGDGGINEAAHVANMVNQLCVLLHSIRLECVGYHSEHRVSELRSCPHCGLIWTRVEGCDGTTTCGSRPNAVNDVRESSYTVLATYTFGWVSNKLEITKTGDRMINSKRSSSQIGCGKSINWKEMPTVPVPPGFEQTVEVCTNDIKSLPPSKLAKKFEQAFDKKLETATRKLKVKEPPKTV